MPRSAGNFFLIIKDPRVCGGQRCCRVSQGLVGVEERERERDIVWRNGENEENLAAPNTRTRVLVHPSESRGSQLFHTGNRIPQVDSYILPAGVKDIDPIHSRVARYDEIHLEKIANIAG